MLAHLGAVVRRCWGVGVRCWPTVRVGLASYWMAGIGWAVMTALHWHWYFDGGHGAEVLSGYGAGLVLIGVWAGAGPYLQAGLRGTAVEQTTTRALVINPSAFGGDFGLAVAAARKARTDEVMPTLIAERVVAVAVVLLGTFLNGYGAPLARRWGLHG